MLFEDRTYLHNKNKLTKEQQEEMESKFDIYFHCILKGVESWNPLITTWEHSCDLTREKIGNMIGINVIAEIRDSYPIGFNYDIDGNRL